jgi:hypothetical protein
MTSDGSIAYGERCGTPIDACGPCAMATSHSFVQVTGKRATALMPPSRCACSRLAGLMHTVSGIFSKDAIGATAVNRSIILGVVVEVLTCAQHWFGSPS